MAIYGIGAMYGRNTDKLRDFVIEKCACIGWEEFEAPATHKMLAGIKTGDIMYIKSMGISDKTLNIKAIGVVFDDQIKNFSNLGKGVSVKWIWTQENKHPIKVNITTEMYKNNVFNNTLYEEYNPFIQSTIMRQLFGDL